METEVKCFIAVDEQPEVQPTYIGVDCSLLVNNDTDAIFGVSIPCELDVNRDTVEACINTSQGIRVTITVGEEDVSDSIIGHISISHSINYISTFSFQLGDSKYSPLTDSNIAINAEVVITVYINGQEIKMFTGLVDETYTSYDGGYTLNIIGRDYGKKLLDKTLTLISVQESANRKYRGSIVEYMAGQADITSLNVPIGDPIVTDHSFQDQKIWNMIQKECSIEGWYIRFDENNVMQVKTKSLNDYPDWEYGEDKFVQIGLQTTDKGIINKVIILGAIYEETTITQEKEDTDGNPWTCEIAPAEEKYEYTDYSFAPSFEAGEVVTGWSEGDATIKVTATYAGFVKPSGYVFPTGQKYKFTISGSDSGKIYQLAASVTGGATIISQGSNDITIARDLADYPDCTEAAFTLTITFKIKDLASGGVEELEEDNPEETFTETVTYTQVKATVTDSTSIGVYGERKPNNEGTLPYPLAETEAQCKRVGENLILESHRFTKQPDFEVPFNPKLIVGQTVELTDKKIGYDEDSFLAEQVNHDIYIDRDTGKIKARTKFAGVFYA